MLTLCRQYQVTAYLHLFVKQGQILGQDDFFTATKFFCFDTKQDFKVIIASLPDSALHCSSLEESIKMCLVYIFRAVLYKSTLVRKWKHYIFIFHIVQLKCWLNILCVFNELYKHFLPFLVRNHQFWKLSHDLKVTKQSTIFYLSVYLVNSRFKVR